MSRQPKSILIKVQITAKCIVFALFEHFVQSMSYRKLLTQLSSLKAEHVPVIYKMSQTLSDEERMRREKRRQKNKEAAARCRQRRVDLIHSLSESYANLQQENKRKSQEVDELKLKVSRKK